MAETIDVDGRNKPGHDAGRKRIGRQRLAIVFALTLVLIFGAFAAYVPRQWQMALKYAF